MSVDFDTAHAKLAQRVSAKALAHCERVAETSAALARIYGIDVEEARLAGLLHDWDREVPHDQLIASAEREGLLDHRADRMAPRLLHARTAAASLASELPGLSADVLSAVERHTLGAIDMSPLDMVVYVADMIEPGRQYKGVDDLREAAGTISLEDLFAEAYRHSLLHVVRARKPIHPLTVEVWNALVARGRP